MKIIMKRSLFNLLLMTIIISGCDALLTESNLPLPKKEPKSDYFYPMAESSQAENRTYRTIYVPVYSHVYISGGGRLNMAVTLIVRNTDFTHPLIIKSVRYFDTAGKEVEDYLEKPHVLTAMASTFFFIQQTDTRGGIGANFIVEISADTSANKPLIDAVMTGVNGTQGFTINSQSQVIENK